MAGRARSSDAASARPADGIGHTPDGPLHHHSRPPRVVLARRWAVMLGVLALVGFAISAAVGGGTSAPPAPAHSQSRTTATSAPHLVVATSSWHLPAPTSRAAVVAENGELLLLGGLTSGDVSSAAVIEINPHTGATTHAGTLATAVHDTAGAYLAGRAVTFGGGAATSLATVQGYSDHATTTLGTLPEPRSDLAAAVIGSRAYVLGGFDGSALVRSVLSTTDGAHFTVAGALAQPVRYPAVATLGGAVWVIGGQLGTAEGTSTGGQTADIQRFDPATGRTRIVGHLPVSLGHASAVALGGELFVLGGRSGDALSRTIWRINTTTGAPSAVGSLAYPRSDAAAIVLGKTAFVLGGETSGPTAPLTSVLELHLASGTAPVAARAEPARATRNIYAAAGPNMLSPVVRNMPYRIYVPESGGSDVDVIDPATYKVIARYQTGTDPQHVVPAWNLKTLYATNDLGDSLTPINPYTGRREGPNIPVTDPYNMYFTPNGKYAIVVEEARRVLAFRNPKTFKLEKALPVACAGVDHGDFSADGTFAIFSCEFSGQMLKVNLKQQRVVGYLKLPGGSPQDVKLDPTGTTFYVADMNRGGVWEVSAADFKVVGFIPTGRDAHGLYTSRNGRDLYVSNRGAGSVSVIDFATRSVKEVWHIPGGGSPDMGNVSPDGKVLWLSGRYNDCVYAISTTTGRLLAEIPVPNMPHGLAVWPQPGRYSLGHTGIMR